MRTTARTVLPLLLSAVLALPAAAETWEKSFDVAGIPSLAVRTNDGSVRVDTWNKKTIGVRVVTAGWHLGSRGVTVDAHQSGDRVELEVRTPSWTISFGIGHSVRIEVMLPAKADLDVHTGDGSVTLGPLAGNIRVHTGDGAITASGLAGEISLETADGHVSATGLDGRLRVHSGDGALRVSGRFDGLELTSGDGSIQARVEAGSKVASDWLVRTGDGRIHLGLPRDLKADLDAHTGDGGITLDLPVQVTGRVTHSTVVGSLNGGGPAIMIRSGDGSISIGPA
jgi:hypothetical protein